MRIPLSFWSSPRNDLNLVRLPMISTLWPSTRMVLPMASPCGKNISRIPLAMPLVAGQAVRGAELHLVHPKRARAELFRHVHQLLVQPGDDGSDGDYSGGADEHAEDREKRPELVGAERVERQRQVFANMLTVSLHGFQS